MRNLRGIVGKVLGTFALVAAFFWLLGRIPMLPDSGPGPGIPGAATERVELNLPALPANTGLIPPEAHEILSALEAEGSIQPSLGLFKARFAGTEEEPGFVNEEHSVAGECAGAGRRFVEAACEDCGVVGTSEGANDLPGMLIYSSADGAMRAVTADCVAVAEDGTSIVSTIAFGSERIDLSGGSEQPASGTVPLIAGARRLAEIEVGSWVATFDEPGRPSTALDDMAAALTGRGWREAAGPAGMQSRWSGERVFVNAAGDYGVVSMSLQDGTYQLVTIVASGAGG